MEYLAGLMVEGIKETIIMIRSMDSEFTPGPTGDSMQGNGKTDNNMDKEFIKM